MEYHIRYIIDLDGFHVTEFDSSQIIAGSKKKNKKFLWKELGVTDVREKKTTLYTFQLPIHFSELSMEEKKSAIFLRDHKTGLHFRNYPNDLPMDSIFGIVNGLIRVCDLTAETIAFKGGDVERQLLEYHGFFDYIDLEDYSCPKFEKLILRSQLRDIVSTYELLPPPKYCCERHHPLHATGSTPHCPASETAYFAAWLFTNHFIPK